MSISCKNNPIKAHDSQLSGIFNNRLYWFYGWICRSDHGWNTWIVTFRKSYLTYQFFVLLPFFWYNNIVIFKRLKVQIKEYNKSGLPWEWDHCLLALYCYFFSVCSHPRHSEVNRHPPLAHQTLPSCPILQYCTFYFSLVTLNSTIYKTFRSLTSASYSLDQPHPPP